MLGLPKETELSKIITKKAIFSKFSMNSIAKEKFNEDIKKITIVNEVSSNTTRIAKGQDVEAFYVLLVALKNKDFSEKTIAQISKLINQNIVFILEHDGEALIAIHHTKLMKAQWRNIDELKLMLKGMDLDKVWGNIVVQISGVVVEEGNSLEEQILKDEKRKKLEKKIDVLKKKARAEKQPKKKLEFANEIKRLEREVE